MLDTADEIDGAGDPGEPGPAFGVIFAQPRDQAPKTAAFRIRLPTGIEHRHGGAYGQDDDFGAGGGRVDFVDGHGRPYRHRGDTQIFLVRSMGKVAGGPGFEPGLSGSEPEVLPQYTSPTYTLIFQ